MSDLTDHQKDFLKQAFIEIRERERDGDYSHRYIEPTLETMFSMMRAAYRDRWEADRKSLVEGGYLKIANIDPPLLELTSLGYDTGKKLFDAMLDRDGGTEEEFFADLAAEADEEEGAIH